LKVRDESGCKADHQSSPPTSRPMEVSLRPHMCIICISWNSCITRYPVYPTSTQMPDLKPKKIETSSSAFVPRFSRTWVVREVRTKTTRLVHDLSACLSRGADQGIQEVDNQYQAILWEISLKVSVKSGMSLMTFSSEMLAPSAHILSSDCTSTTSSEHYRPSRYHAMRLKRQDKPT
jgi:hypothetical protein